MSDVCCVTKFASTHFASFYGTKAVAGVTYGIGVGKSYRLSLHHKASGSLVKQTASADDGTYSLTHIADLDYYLVGLDFRADPVVAAVSDKLTLTDMVVPDF